MKKSTPDTKSKTDDNERGVEHVLQALTTASGIETDMRVQVQEINQNTRIVSFLANNVVVRSFATALTFSGKLVKAIYRALPSVTSSTTIDDSVTTSTVTVNNDLDTDDIGDKSDDSADLLLTTQSIVLDPSDGAEEEDNDAEIVVVSTATSDPLDKYVSELNVTALTREARESGALVVDTLGRVFTPEAIQELGIGNMQPIDDSHGLYRTCHTALSSRGAKRVEINAELAGQVLAHPKIVASIIRGTREPISSADEADALGDADVEPLDGNVFNVSTTGNTVTTTFNLFAFLQLLSLHCTSALTTPIIAQVIGSDVGSFTVHLETLKKYVGAELAELIFNPTTNERGQIELTPIMLPQVSTNEAIDAITPKSLFSFAIDTSGSMDEPNQKYSNTDITKLDIAKEKLKVTIAKLTSSTPNWTIVLTKFASETTVLRTFDSTDSTIKDIYLVIDNLSTCGSTRLYGTATEQLGQIVKLASSQQYTYFATVLFTDGRDNASKYTDQSTVVKSAEKAVDTVENLQIFTVELGGSNHEFFTQMAQVSGCTHIPLDNMSDLSAFDSYIRLLNKNTSVVKFLTDAFEVFSRMVATEGEITVGNTIIKPDAKFEVNKILHYIAAPETTLAKIHDGIFLTESDPTGEYVLIGDSGKQNEDFDVNC